jgi:hypothetical protein
VLLRHQPEHLGVHLLQRHALRDGGVFLGVSFGFNMLNMSVLLWAAPLRPSRVPLRAEGP